MDVQCPCCGKVIDVVSVSGTIDCPYCYAEMKYVDGKGLVRMPKQEKKKTFWFFYWFSFFGRVPRSGYWWVCFDVILTSFVAWSLTFFLPDFCRGMKRKVPTIDISFAEEIPSHAIQITIGFAIFALVSLLPISARRLHDMNLSGWWSLWSMVCVGLWFVCPYIAYGGLLLEFLILGSVPGSNGKNRFAESTDDGSSVNYDD